MSIGFLGLLASCIATISNCCNYSEFQNRLNNISSLEDEEQILSELNMKYNHQNEVRVQASIGFYIGGESCTVNDFTKNQESKLSKTIEITLTHDVWRITMCESVIKYTPQYKDAYFILLRE